MVSCFLKKGIPYDPRHLFRGKYEENRFVLGLCDKGTFHEIMDGWAKTVVVGRGRIAQGSEFASEVGIT